MSGTGEGGQGNAVDSDPDSLRQRIQEATVPLVATAAALTDGQAPGVLAAARLEPRARADARRPQCRRASQPADLGPHRRRDTPVPEPGAREEAIEEGAGRAAAELAADLRQSAAAFAEEAASLPAPAWDVPVRGVTGPEHPAWFVLFRRLTQVEVHHVDLGAGTRRPTGLRGSSPTSLSG
jgi:maleylpyruvate isomerase